MAKMFLSERDSISKKRAREKLAKHTDSNFEFLCQIPAPTYLLAKRLYTNTPYVPDAYSLKPSAEFLEALRVTPAGGYIASMEVESLFTNVPVDETIQMILDKVYRDPDTPPLNIPEHALRALLEICTKKAPFSDHRGRMYTQIDGVAMGSPLGVLFANFYMGTVEERVFQNSSKPRMYVRYIDDTFVSADSQEEIERLRRGFHDHSCFSFTIEHCQDRRLPFLDVLVEQQVTRFRTNVYTKPTNLGMCMNGKSECPERYKHSTISAFVRRALSHCSPWRDTHSELERTAQVLVDNGH
ncbi:uncharacterized protein LOC135195264 [Macrobrachium nipponense]|uniref:uncharacterized protein LOC135195264 n=1 Tax=Macrobrachium nipponense TaxID=159736 RepID=UPI0030C894F1